MDLNKLLLPISDRVGAVQKTSKLIDELNHPNIDWKFVISSIRSYMFDYVYDVIPHAGEVLPILFFYMKDAVRRKKASSHRAADTFFDRYTFIITKITEGNNDFRKLKETFDASADEFLDLLIVESRDGFYFENIWVRLSRFAESLIKGNFGQDDLLKKTAVFLMLQYQLYVKRSITTGKEEIDMVNLFLEGCATGQDIISLLYSLSSEAYGEKISTLEKITDDNPARIFAQENDILDFSHNSRIWEKICLLVKMSIEKQLMTDSTSIKKIIAYLVQKSNQGADRELQLFISRSVSSVCSVFATSGNFPLLKNIIDIVMPVLLYEIEKGGNYASAFSTIFNMGKTVIESDNITIIDHFETILVKSKFCFPQFSGIASDWSVITNSSHLDNIRTWMKLIELNPPIMKKLSACLIVNLKLGGVFLKDTDVFQRDISELLNSNYTEVFYLITSLAAVFPAFYHDIGATGDIRAFTEKIDTNHQMNDLIHFVRKQVHVESSSRTVYIIERVMEFWMTGNKKLLHNLVPMEVYDRLDHFFKLINLDEEELSRLIYEKAKEQFPQHAGERFWDFLNAVGKESFLDFLNNAALENTTREEKEKISSYFIEYFNTKLPTEMTKILNFIKSISGIEGSDTLIYEFVYQISDEDFRKMFEAVSQCDISKLNIEKFITFLHVYRMLYDKYNFTDIRTIEKLERYAKENLFTPPENFFPTLRGEDAFAALALLLEVQYTLKNDVLLSAQVFDPLDTIEFKRHIAFGIPSMYGFYKEKKFDTLKVFFHMNLIREHFFEDIIDGLGNFSEKIDYEKIKKILKLFYQTLLIDGLANQEMMNIFNLLETPNLKISQFRDIITNLLVVHGEISDRFNATFRLVCKEAIKNIGIDRISKQYIPRDNPENIEVIIDRFLRDQIMQSPLLQLFDNLLLKLRDRLSADMLQRGDIKCLNQAEIAWGSTVYEVIRLPDDPNDPYDPCDPYNEREYAPIHDIKKLSQPPEEGKTFAPVWEIGSKAHGLLFVANLEGVHAPPGIILSSELYKRLKDDIVNDPTSKKQMKYLLKRYIDTFAGGRFGNPHRPVLLSVRSGAVFSMPGVMDTITNVGMSQPIINYYEKIDPWFAYDCYRRFLQDISTSFYSMDRRVYENLMYESKKEAGVDLKEKLTGVQMKEICLRYKKVIEDRGHHIPNDPYEQLLYSIVAVYRSWDADIAKKYREFVNMSDEWGTAVIIQNMVFGNLSPDGITGVVHSRYMGHENISLFGEYKTRAQGHDVVSGVARVFPISEDQRKVHKKSSQYDSLEKTNPHIYKIIFDSVKKIRDKWGNDVEIEFTVENNMLYILQIRGMINHVFDTEELIEGPEELMPALLGQGLAASGGAVSGRAVFNIARIEPLRKKYPDDKLILIRPETNPEDVVGIKKSDAILTCIGGMTSHAVLQMRRLEKSGVSDFSIMRINTSEDQGVVTGPQFENKKFIIHEGDFITIDGSTGHVYTGYHKTRKKIH